MYKIIKIQETYGCIVIHGVHDKHGSENACKRSDRICSCVRYFLEESQKEN